MFNALLFCARTREAALDSGEELSRRKQFPTSISTVTVVTLTSDPPRERGFRVDLYVIDMYVLLHVLELLPSRHRVHGQSMPMPILGHPWRCRRGKP